MSFQLHFRNFEDNVVYFAVNHAGGGGIPYVDGCPRCWWVQMADNPTGGTGSSYDGATGGTDASEGTTVYVPSDWVVHFDNWFNVLIDGLKLVADVGLFVASEGEDADALADAVQDVFQVTEDALTAAAEKGNVDFSDLADNASKSLSSTCASIGLSVSQVKALASKAFGSDSNWALLAGKAYQDAIYNDNDDTNGGHGWVITASDPDDYRNPQYACNGCFIHKNTLVFIFESGSRTALWPART